MPDPSTPDVRTRRLCLQFTTDACREIVQHLIESIEDDIADSSAGFLLELLLWPPDKKSDGMTKFAYVDVAADLIERWNACRDRDMEGN
jgi:hypothetical protein